MKNVTITISGLSNRQRRALVGGFLFTAPK